MTRGSGNAKGYLERAIYNVYQKAAELASRQMKLKFGPEWDFDDEMVMPSVPQSINVQKSIKIFILILLLHICLFCLNGRPSEGRKVGIPLEILPQVQTRTNVPTTLGQVIPTL